MKKLTFSPKNFIAIVSLLLFFGFFPISMVSADHSRTVIYFEPLEVENVQESGTFDLSVMIDPGDMDITAVQININFDPDALNLSSVVVNQDVWNVLASANINNDTGTVSLSVGVPPGENTEVTELTEIIKLHFESLVSVRGVSLVEFTENTKASASGFLDDVLNYREGAMVYFSMENRGFAYVSWDAVSPAPAGYNLYYGLFGREGGNPNDCGMCGYENVIDIGNNLSHNFNDLLGGRNYYFSVTSYDSNGTESAFQDEFELETPVIASDLNDDGRVDATDLAILMSAWSSSGRPTADINRDNHVNAIDLAIMLSQWTG